MVTAPAQPSPLPRPALDSHTHLDMLDLPVSGVVASARAAGIVRIVTVGTDLESSRWSARCAAEHDAVYAAVAIHPNETQAVLTRGDDPPEPPAHGGAARPPVSPREVLAGIEALARSPRVVAVGETGLDYYRHHAAPDVQRWWYRAHITIAKRSGKALMIHDREAHADVLRVLEEEGPPDRVVFHCFSGDVAMVRQCAEAGYVMSFAGNVTYRNAQPLRDAAAAAPAELILAETDAPFLTPVPNRGKPNEPALTADTLRCLAEVKGLDLAGLCDTVSATAGRVFGPW
jgi:TatD DNase family protein